ncbi:hypothetical protein TVAG_497430 [Trichomonas vaginalis G3]|uniref:Uncharacterized protein n=1 Tax=Trichomonas vaginalis (strain ATCC PRA-98 / G3) TaxID=412133 RepID=A2EGY5_TRIV3|nr:hypothetical protein TVAGG3_0803350 [Trichomonas vaginalis G3]EAY08119.1 hypothetical protein TVAG_497430 [Trichomonas vaginalis G3]KAI5496666.1 hypothetical protein TVAGG3_0803350 [Trichomonas vaginalis G3]|eukprot:XP_001320342.1 hypothetical protein [Trichomonas vaginalis G3]
MGGDQWPIPQIEESHELFCDDVMRCTTNDKLFEKYNNLCDQDRETIKNHFLNNQKCRIQHTSGFKFKGAQDQLIYLVYSVYIFNGDDERPQGRTRRMRITQLDVK